MKIAIVIPTYNEATNVPELFARLSAVDLLDAEIVIIDDASPDGTAEISRQTLCRHSKNILERKSERGLGGAILHGMRHALNNNAEIIVTMDADLSHAPEALPALIAEVVSGADLALGSRRVTGGSVVGWSRWRDLLSRAASWAARYILGVRSRDVTTGLRAYSANFLRTVDLGAIRSKGYAFQEEMVMRAESAGHKVKEIPISFVDRKHGASKLSLSESLGSFGSLLGLRLGMIDRRSFAIFVLLAVAALVLRFMLAPGVGCEYDLAAFGHWAANGSAWNFLAFFGDKNGPILTFPNYALYFPILAWLGPVADSATDFGRFLLKTPSIVADIVLAAIIYRAAKPKWKIVSASFYLFGPAIWFDSAVFGQTDVFHSLFMVLTILALADRKFKMAWVCMALGAFFKFQTIMILPLVIAYHLREVGIKKAWRDYVPAGILAVIITAAYAAATSLPSLMQSLFNNVGRFPLITINAWNLWYLVWISAGRWVYDTETIVGIPLYTIGMFLFILVSFFIVNYLPKRANRHTLAVAAVISCLSFYLLATEMHERYLYPLIPLAALILAEGMVPLIVAIILSISIFLNISYVLPWWPAFGKIISMPLFQATWSIINVICLVVLFVWYAKRREIRGS